MGGSAETEGASQLGLGLSVRDPYAPHYLIPHSGIAAALEGLEQIRKALREDPCAFKPVVLFGPRGCGKTHLSQSFLAVVASDADGTAERAVYFDFGSTSAETNEIEDESVAKFISTYERLKSNGGCLLVEAAYHPRRCTDNPHILSRLLACELFELSYPREEELPPLFRSLAERANLRLSERNMEFLLKRLPSDPLSFAAILGKIDELSLSQGRPATLNLIREALE